MTATEPAARNARIQSLRRIIWDAYGYMSDDYKLAKAGISWGGPAADAGRELLALIGARG